MYKLKKNNVFPTEAIRKHQGLRKRQVFTYYATLQANQTTGLGVNNPIQFNNLTSDTSSYAPVISLSNGNFTLPTGYKYEFIGQTIDSFTGTTGQIRIQMYDISTSSYFAIGQHSDNISTTDTVSVDSEGLSLLVRGWSNKLRKCADYRPINSV